MHVYLSFKYFMFTQNFRISEIQNTWLDQLSYTTEEYVTQQEIPGLTIVPLK